MSKIPNKITCGVKPGKIQSYKLEDHFWSQPANRTKDYAGVNLTPVFDALIDFSNRCVFSDGSYWMKNGMGSHWVKKGTPAMAKKEAVNLWFEQPIGPQNMIIDMEFLNAFFDGKITIVFQDEYDKNSKPTPITYEVGSCPQFENSIAIPHASPFLLYNNQKLLNTWVDNSISASEDNVKYARPFLRLIYRSLCDGEELHSNPTVEMDMLVEQVQTGNYTNNDFKFLIMWLAALVQKPGINLLTNIFLCGSQEGVGKGTLITVMNLVLGSNMVTKLNTSDVMRGWTDHLLGKVLVEVNELKPETTAKQGWGPERWATWIKENSIEEEVSISGRGRTPIKTLNIGNYIFTTNDENPIYLDKSDRRNYLIKTTDDPQWVEYAIQFNTQIANPHAQELACGFRWLLECVDIDLAYISKAHINQFKKDVIEGSIDSVESWVAGDVTITQGTWVSARDLFAKYKKWISLSFPADQAMSETQWGRKLSSLKHLGVEKRRTMRGVEYKFGPMIESAFVDKTAIRDTIAQSIQEECKDIDFGLDITTVVVERKGKKSIEAIREKLLQTEFEE